MKNKKIMILGASILQLPAIRTAREMGLQVVAVDMNPDAVGFLEPGIQKEVISTIDIPKVLEAARRHEIDGIMTLASDMPMVTVAAVAKELGCVGITEETAIKATNKAQMRKALCQAGVPIPKFYKVTNRSEYAQAVGAIKGPFMVKPADSSGSRGIIKVDPTASSETVAQAYDYSMKNTRKGELVVEEYMQGPEVSVETLTIDGICQVIQITDKRTTGAPHFVEMGHSQPTAFDAAMAEQIRAVAVAANRAVGITNGPSHTEIIVTEEGPKVVELGARLGGDCITTHLVPLSTGVDMVRCCIRIALGEEPDWHAKWEKGSAIRYFSQSPGMIRSIRGLTEAEAIPGVKQISIVHGVGETVTEINSSGARIGFVIACGETAEEAAQRCQEAMDQVKITIE